MTSIKDNKISFQKRTWLTSLIIAFFAAYPNNAWFLCELGYVVDKGDEGKYVVFFLFRFCMLWLISWFLMKFDFKKLRDSSMCTYLGVNLLVTLGGFAIYQIVTHVLPFNFDHFLSMLMFQFIFIWLICTAIGYIDDLFEKQRRKDSEIEQLRIENLESRCNALTNQINPHFFFNSLNGISSLVRRGDKKETIGYIDELSSVFRYILQSEKKSVVSLDEELNFVDAYKRILQVRYANKLSFDVNIEGDASDYSLPVLSLLPLLENVITHNTIDSEHLMTVKIYLNDKHELVVENPIYEKLDQPTTHGTGIRNLTKRFELLIGTELRTENDGKTFRVIMPMKEREY